MAITGENLINSGLLTREQLEFCLSHQSRLRANGIELPIGQIILLNGFATKDAVDAAISESKGLKNLQIPDSIRTKYKIYIHGIKDNILEISSISPLNGSKESLKNELKQVGLSHINEIREVPLSQSLIHQVFFPMDRIKKIVQKLESQSLIHQVFFPIYVMLEIAS
jgi:hypothetical protein